MTFAIFIDGPLVGETKLLHDAPPTFRVPIPKSVAWCDCYADNDEVEVEQPYRDFEYHLIMRSPNGEAVLYSKHSTVDEAVVKNVSEYVVTNFISAKTDTLRYHCGDRRAYR